ncbi:hypothetical protein GCM10018777_56100 [Streptomyces albogriseolus]|uniref:hypothetical protein n=1 Tax=Streptomyces TaxID=1883 RepID=UPI001674536D|nr:MULTISPECIES: hypothetical protein [Streptomyces]GHB14201.1 hypothetical protein GCM10010330_79980 [Streptomyces tendae]GHG32913.1 hypothetical protein GCM10018777_56100 [Streptomyces viridodiastaticus]
MALAPVPIATKNAEHSAQQFRMMIKDLARGNQGVTEGDDMKVTALATPGAGVQIADGSAVIAGKVSAVQGFYTAYNIGSDTVSIAATGGVGRSDMIVLRVEDPEYEGDREPAVDPIVFFEVIPNVSSSATTVPAGYSAIPLARIDIPASTATITNAMVKDLRQVANPRRDRRIYTAYPATSSSLTKTAGYKDWPADAQWSVPIPAWAGRANIVVTMAGISMSTGAVWVNFQTVIGSRAGQDSVLDDNQTGVRRSTEVIADTFTMPSAMRGTTQTLKVQASPNLPMDGTISVNNGTAIVADVEFVEDVY